jgi:hypothetical protein
MSRVLGTLLNINKIQFFIHVHLHTACLFVEINVLILDIRINNFMPTYVI